MATSIRMPEFGTTVEEVKVVLWLKQVGDTVRRGEPLCEVETDKATVEFESFAEGVLLAQLVPEGTSVEEGQIIAWIGQAGESVPAEGAAPVTPVASASEAKVSPLIRNLAKREGVDLAAVTPTGPGGLVTRNDVLRSKTSGAAAPSMPAGASLSSRQRVIAARVSQSHREIVPIHLNCRVEMSAAEALRERTLRETGRNVSIDAIFVYAISRILGRFPHFRSRLKGETLVPVSGMHVGVAMSFGEDLYTPAVLDPDGKTLDGIDADIRALAARAKTGGLSSAEMSGACITISNLGMYPVMSFNAVIPPDQSAALAVGAVEPRVILRDGATLSIPTACVTLSVDHRIINGREAAEFLAALKQTVETL